MFLPNFKTINSVIVVLEPENSPESLAQKAVSFKNGLSTPKNISLGYMSQASLAVRYGTFRICVLRTSHLEPYRTSVPHLSSIFKAYRTNVLYPYHYKKSVTCQRTVLFSKN